MCLRPWIADNGCGAGTIDSHTIVESEIEFYVNTTKLSPCEEMLPGYRDSSQRLGASRSLGESLLHMRGIQSSITDLPVLEGRAQYALLYVPVARFASYLHQCSRHDLQPVPQEFGTVTSHGDCTWSGSEQNGSW